MALIMVPYASRAATPFPECMQLVAADERVDVIALAWDEGYISNAARAVYEGHNRNGIAIYDAGTRTLLARFSTSFPLNALALHAVRDELAIATGSYDGGYIFEGQLVIWNWRTGAWHSELADNREVTTVSWRGDDVVMTISPPTDAGPQITMAFEITPARAGAGHGWNPYAEPWQVDPRLDASRGRAVASEPAPSETFERYRPIVRPHARVTAIEWIADGRIAIGTADSALQLWEPANGRTHELRVDSEVVAMWRHPQHELLLQIDGSGSSTALYALVGDRLEILTSFATPHSCSVDKQGRILARSLTEKAGPMSKVIDRDGRVVELALGHYDVFNHFIRLDGGNELYFLQGTPPSSHLRKNLCAITARGEVEVRMGWDADTHHAMSSIGTLVDDRRLARGFLVHDPKGLRRGVIELCDLTGRSLWRHEIEGGIAAMASWQGCVIAGLLDGTLLGLDIETGKVVHHEPFVFGSSPAMVTAIAVHDEAIALGSIDGRVEVVAWR